MAQPGSALALGARGRRFESGRPDLLRKATGRAGGRAERALKATGQARGKGLERKIPEGGRVVVLDPDIAQVFTTPESVNAVLRALIATMPRTDTSDKAA